MKKVENAYGIGVLAGEHDLIGTVYTKCCACMNVYAEFLSWANDQKQRRRFVSVSDAKNIVVLGCQINDTAILNDLRHLERLMTDNPNKNFYIGGCLAKRFDVELPDGVIRLDTLRVVDQWILNKKLVDYADPFWVENFDTTDYFILDSDKYRFLYNQGHLFRNSYPLRIGGGCYFGSDVCSKSFSVPLSEDKYTEFMTSSDPVLVTGTISSSQVFDWVQVAVDLRKRISFRNMSPAVMVEHLSYLDHLSEMGLINALHVVMHTDNVEALNDFGLDHNAVREFLGSLKFFKTHKTILATTVITGYKTFPNTPSDTLSKFDYVTSIPYWDGVWNREIAEIRWRMNFPWSV